MKNFFLFEFLRYTNKKNRHGGRRYGQSGGASNPGSKLANLRQRRELCQKSSAMNRSDTT